MNYMTVAAITATGDTVGIADSDLYFDTPDQINASLDKMQSLGVTDVRVFVPWADVNPAQGTYDWSKVDAVVAAANARNMGVLAVVTSSPAWAVAPGDAPISSPPANPADYGNFMGLMAQRYVGEISAYEVWNEPNGYLGFSPQPDAVKYTALLKAAYPAIKAADPAATVIGGVVGATATIGNLTVNAPTFVQQMYAAGAQGYFDALSIHPYQLSTPYSQGATLNGSPLNDVANIRAQMVAAGDGSKQIWASEYGLPTSQVSQAQQAAYIADFLNGWSGQSYAGPSFIYTTQDRNSASTNPEDTFGVFNSDGTPKPAAQVIADFIATHPGVTVPPTTTPTDLATWLMNQIAQLQKNFAMNVQQQLQQQLAQQQAAQQQVQTNFAQQLQQQIAAALAAAFNPPAPQPLVQQQVAQFSKLAAAPLATAPVDVQTSDATPVAADVTSAPTTPSATTESTPSDTNKVVAAPAAKAVAPEPITPAVITPTATPKATAPKTGTPSTDTTPAATTSTDTTPVATTSTDTTSTATTEATTPKTETADSTKTTATDSTSSKSTDVTKDSTVPVPVG